MVRPGLGLPPGKVGLQRAAGGLQRGLGLACGLGGVVVDLLDVVQPLGHGPQAPPCLGLRQRGQALGQRIGLTAPLRIGLAAVEQRQERVSLPGVAGGQLQHQGRATVLVHFVRQRLEQGLARHGQQIGAVPQAGAAQRLERPPDAHPHSGRLGRQGDEEDGPHVP